MQTSVWSILVLFMLSPGLLRGMPALECGPEILGSYGLADTFTLTTVGNANPSPALVEETALFLHDLHRDLHGQPPLFSEVRFRPSRGLSGRRLQWAGGEVLTIFVPKTGWGESKIDAEELRRLWNRGKQFPWAGIRKKPLIQSRWDLLNPVGELRLTLRRSLDRIALKIGGEIGRLLETPPTGDRRARLIDGIRRFAEAHGIAAQRLAEISESRWEQLDGLPIEGLEGLLRRMIAFVENPRNLDEMADAVIADMQGFPDNYDHQVVEVAVGLVAVTNDHHILVGLSTGSRRFGRYLEPPQRRRRYYGLALGLIAGIATSDLVGLRVDFRNALHLAALGESL